MNSPVRAEVKPAPVVRKPQQRKALSFGFQLRAVLPVIVYVLLFLALTTIFVWVPFSRQIAADPSPVVQALLSAQLVRIEWMLAPFLLITAGVASVYALLRARRIAGPVSDIREGLARLTLGDTEPLVLQPGDEFRELEAPFNGVASRLDHITRSNLEMLRLLRRNLEGISQRSTNRQLSDSDLRESLAVLLRDVDSEIKKLQMKS